MNLDNNINYIKKLKLSSKQKTMTALFQRFNIPNGLKDVGFGKADIPNPIEGTRSQHRVTKLSPRPAGNKELGALFKDAMQY